MSKESGSNSVLIVCGTDRHHDHTCARLISSNVNVKGICRIDKKRFGLPVERIVRRLKRKGVWSTISQILARIVYTVKNRRADKKFYRRIFDSEKISKAFSSWTGIEERFEDIGNGDVKEFTDSIAPDIIVVHCPYIIPSQIINAAKEGIVIGGHPGLTNKYRGSHSAFWAIYNRKKEEVGYTLFLLDEGVDTGDIVRQGKVNIETGDSFKTLEWKGMYKISDELVDIIESYNAKGVINVRNKLDASDSPYYDLPKLSEYIEYIWLTKNDIIRS